MEKRQTTLILVSLLLFFSTRPLTAQTSPGAASHEALLKNLPWRNIGPAVMGGRIDDIDAVEGHPGTIYIATASGGAFKSVNNGTTWEPIFDNQETSSVGDITLAPSNPNIVWIGTGEANNRQSSSWGNGVYKSTDGGKTWTHCGLTDTMHIGRIQIHPRNPEIVYVAAVGRLWGPNRERGVFKTSDGGKTWEQVLFINEDTGVTDIALDPQNPDILYAAAYQRRRTPFGYNGGGPGSGIYRTINAGKSWQKLSKGLPTEEMGRIGLAVFPRNPKIVYAIVEYAKGTVNRSEDQASKGSVFRSEDQGETWTKMSDTNYRPSYYSKIYVDPANDQRVYVLDLPVRISDDGGKTFRAAALPRIHSDFHALWINPANPDHLIAGCDGGINLSYDGGKTWDFVNTIPLAQFYEICYDFRKPYWVYGGLQDNGSWGAPVSTPTLQGLSNADWIRVGGGDGFYVQVDPTDPNILYWESQQGNVNRMNLAVGESRSIRPRPPTGEPAYRFDWNSPLLISPHNPRKILFGGNRLFISTDRGDSWRRTEDLTTNPDRSKMPIIGVLPHPRMLSRDDGQATFGQIVTITESPLKEGLIYAGTDDGNLQVSRDDGKTCKNVAERVPGVPKGTYVSRVVASRHVEGRCYVTFDGHRSNDFRPYVFVTEDYGETWQSITANLPEGGTVSVIREHHRNPNLLFVGTERGCWVTFDRGGRWHRFGAPLPTVPVDDIQIHPRENDLILGTHGRGIWVLDDITPLEQWADRAQRAGFALFDPRSAVSFRFVFNRGSNGWRFFSAPNAPSGGLIQFYLSEEAAKQPVRITIWDRDGKTLISEVRISRPEAGLNRASWDLRHRAASPATTQTGQAEPGGGRRFGGTSGPRVLPGTYRVKLEVGKEERTAYLNVEEDPRLKLSAGERRAHYNALMRLHAMYSLLQEARIGLSGVRDQVRKLQESSEYKQAAKPIQEAVASLNEKLLSLEGRVTGRATPGPPASESESGPAASSSGTGSQPVAQPITPSLLRLISSLDGFTEPPSRATRQQIDDASAEVNRFLKAVNALYDKGIPVLNRVLLENNLPSLKPGERLRLP